MDASIKICLLLSSAVFLLTNCNNSSKPSTAQSPSTEPTLSASASPSSGVTSNPTATTSPDASKNFLISAKGIGAAQLGMPLWKLKEILGPKAEFTVKSPFIVDFDAIGVQQNGETQYYILYLAGQPFTDDDVIQGLLTDNPKYRTIEGVGPGTGLKTAESTYGKATLSYNTQNESREYARFERQPAANVSFGTGSGNKEPAGIYASPTGEFNETQKFRDNATIKSILVVCLSDACSAASPSQAAPSQTPPRSAAPDQPIDQTVSPSNSPTTSPSGSPSPNN